MRARRRDRDARFGMRGFSGERIDPGESLIIDKPEYYVYRKAGTVSPARSGRRVSF
jgi:hypothetical protein